LNPYLALATQYGWANLMFQTNQGPSFPAHQFIFGGTSAPSTADDAAGVFAANNPANNDAGCAAAAGTIVDVLDSKGAKTGVYPCFEHSTVADILPSTVTWRYYAPARTRSGRLPTPYSIFASRPGREASAWGRLGPITWT
jgi:phospholipase C